MLRLSVIMFELALEEERKGNLRKALSMLEKFYTKVHESIGDQNLREA